MMFADTSRGRPFAKDPAVVNYKGRYFLYYSLPPGMGVEGWRIGIAESRNLDAWEKVGEMQPTMDYERNGLCAPGAVVLAGRIHLFYQTYGNGPKDAICRAHSEDGTTFTRDPTNPVFAPTGDWNNGRAIDADVIEHDGQLFLYFATRDPTGTIQMQGVASAAIGSDFARNSWTQRCDASILKPELPWEKSCIEGAALCRHNGLLFMFYAGAYNNQPQQIGCAVSRDGISWKRVSNEPFLPNGDPGAWNSSESGHPFAFTDHDGKTHLFYQGNNDGGKTWYISRVRIDWKDNVPFVM